CRDVLTALGLSAELKGLFHALAAAHVCPLLLKGSDLAFTVYPDPLLRPAADVDLLVRPGDLARALAVLVARGYTRTDEYRTAAEAPHRDSFTYCRGTPVADLHVEMHVGLHRS